MSAIQTISEFRIDDIRATKTKIICTIGPSSNDVDVLCKMMKVGMSVARMNFSHGDFEFHQSIIDNVRAASEITGRKIALMLDTKGPEIRTGKLKSAPVQLTQGDMFTFTTDQTHIGDHTGVATSYLRLPEKVICRSEEGPGTTILVGDGLLAFEAISRTETEVVCEILNSGELGNTKGVNIPDINLELGSVSEKDINDIAFGIANNIDIIAASFINNADDIHVIRNLPGVRENDVKIIAKIESKEGLKNLKSIVEVADGIMVARGDLGVEIPIWQVTNAQKLMIRECNIAGKPVITATQMLESMTVNPRPTRAEVTDVANAVFDGTDCVMLSGETAAGKYPVETVEMMRKICRETEQNIPYRKLFLSLRELVHENKNWMTSPDLSDQNVVKQMMTDSIASSAVKTAWDLSAGVMVALSSSGNAARAMSKYRPHVPIICITNNPATARKVLISRNIIPYLFEEDWGSTDMNELIDRVLRWTVEVKICKPGEIAIATFGASVGVPGSTNQMQCLRIPFEE
jgi:pyruvate kinase